MRFLVAKKHIIIYCFVVMANHIHIIWQMQARIRKMDVRRDFLKYTAQQIKRDLKKRHLSILAVCHQKKLDYLLESVLSLT